MCDSLKTVCHYLLGASPDDQLDNEHLITTCPFCDKDGHFYILATGDDPGAWDCKRCGVSGNQHTLGPQLYDHWLLQTKEADYKRLRAHRTKRAKMKWVLPAAAYKELAYNPCTEQWLLPIRDHANPDKTTNVLTYKWLAEKPFFCSPKGKKSGVYLADGNLATHDTVYVCEGAWDALACRYTVDATLRHHEGPDVAVCGLNGAANQPESWVAALAGKKVVAVFDKDQAGESGVEKLGKQLKALAKGASYRRVYWPSNMPEGYDLTNFLTDRAQKPYVQWQSLSELVEPVVKTTTDGDTTGHYQDDDEPVPCTSFEELVAIFEDTGVHVTAKMRGAMAVSLATILACPCRSDPLWMLIVGPSGCGKSLLLESLLTTPDVVFSTTLTPRSLISGFRIGEGDPSLLNEVTDPQRCLVIKDYTTVLTLLASEMGVLYGLLRDAYDGLVHRVFGNGLIRHYEGYFSFLAGVTPEIHTLSHSHLGERFLKYELAARASVSDDSSVVAAVLSGRDPESDRTARRTRQKAVQSLLAHLRENRPSLSPEDIRDDVLELIVCCAKFVAFSRSRVSRDADRVLRYQASPESASRAAKQFTKLVQHLAWVLGTSVADTSFWPYVRAVAWDSGHGRNRDVLEALYAADHPLGVEEVAMTCHLPVQPARRALQDLRDLGLVAVKQKKTGTRGKPRHVYSLVLPAIKVFEAVAN